MIIRLKSAILAPTFCLLLGLNACMSYAPKVNILPDTEGIPLVQTALAEKSKDNSMLVKALRSGRSVIIKEKAKTDKEFTGSLPFVNFKSETSLKYVPPDNFKIKIPEAGLRHYYNFVITPDFAGAIKLFLGGDMEGALHSTDNILKKQGNEPLLLWQSSCIRVDILLMMGRFDLAETELERTEQIEIKTMGTNHLSRALRAHTRYLAGDIDGAATDAVQVIQSIGSWRFPTFYQFAPLDKPNIGRLATAQVRAQIILGLSLIARGRYHEALPWLEIADQTMNDVMYIVTHPVYGIGFPRLPDFLWARGTTLTFLGAALLALNPESERANETFSHAEAYFKAANYKPGPVLIDLFKAQALMFAKRPNEAQAVALKGVKLSEKMGLFDTLWRLETIRGTALIDIGKWEDAEHAFRHAQSIVDMLSGTMINIAKIRFGIEADSITKNLMKIDLRNNNIPQLFEDIERGRARTFVAQLAGKIISAGMQESIVAQIRYVDKEILRERQKKNAMSDMALLDVNREKALFEKRMALLETLRERNTDLANALSVSTVSIESVQKTLPEGVIMIYALPSDGSQPLAQIIITKTNARLKTLTVNALVFRKHLDAFNASVRGANLIAQRAAIEQLYKDLDIQGLGNASAAYFVPSGDMHFVPGGALNVTFPVAVLPTGGWISRTPLSLPKISEATVVGDPNFGGILPQLHHARDEAVAISNQYKTSPLIGEMATESNLRSRIGKNTDVLHLATHALYDSIYPLQSALILTDGQKAIPLTAEKLFERPLNAGLVVLSACETGMGQVIGGDDLLGLARSFYLGGAYSVITSLWPVEDEAARIFMEVFHSNLKDKDLGKAWLIARDTLRAKGFLPSSYGAFVLGGSLGRSYN